MPVSRREFCTVAGAAGLSTLRNQAVAKERKPGSLRVIAYNVYACEGWPKQRRLARSAVAKRQMAKRLALALALYDPDIITFSESPNESVIKEVAGSLGMNYVRFPSGGSWPGTLMSRFEIVESQNAPLAIERPKELFTRHWGRGTIKLPGGDLLNVHSAHLFPGADPSNNRLREIKSMIAVMKNEIATGRSLLLMGDLNHDPDSEEYRLWMKAGWVDTFAKVGKGKGSTIKSDIPKWRIDYVMATGPIANDILESRPLFEGAFRLHIADKEAFALSDHLPQLAVFQSNE